MQVLKLADDLFGPLREGKKLTTIRKGRRDVLLGALRFDGAEDESLTEVVNVTSVTFTTLAGVAKEVLWSDGFDDHDDALEQMKRFYPDIKLSTEVTVIDFADVS